LERRFQAVKVPPPNEADAIKIIHGIKERYEKFHAVSSPMRQSNSRCRIRTGNSGPVPADKAIDLIDEAGARVKLRQTSAAGRDHRGQKRISSSCTGMDSAIANHEFEKARFYSDEERKERENLRALRDKVSIWMTRRLGIVGREDIEDVVSRWTGVPVTSIKEEETQKLLRVEEELHKRVDLSGEGHQCAGSRYSQVACRPQEPARPIGSFLFLGPTGVGKTEMARTLANFLSDRTGADPLRHVGVYGESTRCRS